MSPRRVKIFLGVSLCIAAGGARAGKENDAFPKLFDPPSSFSHGAEEAVKKVEGGCSYSMYSRIGPTDEQLERCDRAMSKAITGGPEVARAAIAAIDTYATSRTSRHRLYELVARTGGVAMVEPLLEALDRANHAARTRKGESWSIVSALRQATYASLGDRAPWGGADELRPEAWRAWWAPRQAMSREQLLADRITEARGHESDAKIEIAFVSARFLAGQSETRAEGVAALRTLLARKSEDYVHEMIQQTLEQLPKPAPPPAKVVAEKGEPRV
jgi:hypothetical protein